VTALKDLEAVLKQDPNQYVALSDEGWILAQTQQPQLLLQGIGLLSRAVRVEPDYPPARLYRGVAYLSEDDYVPAVNDLRWYLANGPDPQLVARVRQALTQAEAGVARTAKAATPPKSPPAGTAAG
jgi:regulator of sirC expression with transglutaminase-like and TPR domain